MKDLTNQMDSIRTDSNLTKCRETDPREVNLCGVSELDGVSKSNLKENFCVILHSFCDGCVGRKSTLVSAGLEEEGGACVFREQKQTACLLFFFLSPISSRRELLPAGWGRKVERMEWQTDSTSSKETRLTSQ